MAASKNYIDLLNKLAQQRGNPKYAELAAYMDQRLRDCGLSIFDFVPCEGVRWDHADLLPTLWELKEEGFFDGN